MRRECDWLYAGRVGGTLVHHRFAVRRRLAQTSAFAVLGAALLTAPGAWAQTAGAVAPDPAVVQTADADDQESVAADTVDEVVVTGSRIRRDPTNAPAPLIQIGREEILQSGEPNIVDFLADIPALSGSTVPEDTTGNLNTGGLSLLNLRNLGAVRTLTLVDGRRHVGAPQGSLSVDVDTIPRLLIQNTEIITGGQSALYGADAVSGVVNFILRRNFEGVEIDGVVAEINQGGQINRRISGLIGENFLDDRLNIYLHGEYERADEVRDEDIDYLREANFLLNNDTDPVGSPVDGQLDNILISGARDIVRLPGSLLVLASQVLPSPASDPDIPIQACVAAVANTAFNANCFSPEPSTAFTFNPDGTARRVNFGTFRDQNGYTRIIVVGGEDEVNPNTERAGFTRTPRSEAYRLQTGFNFQVASWAQLFAEYKYVEEETAFETQPTFFDIGISNVAVGTQPDFFGSTSLFNIGLDNAYLDATVRNAILSNTRQVISATTGAVTNPSLLDQRARVGLFGSQATGGGRRQRNDREVERYVLGIRGDRDTLFGFIDNFSYEVGFTHGRVENFNQEFGGVDVIRFQNAVDAVVDTTGQVNGRPGEIVCRIQLLQARGTPARNPLSDGNPILNRATDAPYAATDPVLTGCRPARIFGTGGFSPEAQAYVSAGINITHVNEQRNALAFASGELWDFWGAGPIGVAVGLERREEETEGVGRSASTGNRFLFLNTGPDFAPAGYEVDEVFGELRVPLLRDRFFIQNAEISGAYRYSDYTTVGSTETYSLLGLVRPNDDILFRATYGRSVRVPNLSENFAPGTQTFANGFADPCDSLVIATTSDPVIRENRRTNCVAILGAGYDPNLTRLIYTSGVPGRNAGNPFLTPEESRSYTWSIVLTPRRIPGLSLVFDFYDIKITDVISAITAQTAANQCVAGTTLNSAACNTLTRSATDFRLIDFIQGSINFAATEVKGLDFTGRYSFDLADAIGREWGRIDYSLRGNYLIRREDFVNIDDPGDATELDSLVGFPRVRFRQSVNYSPRDNLTLNWTWDWQQSQEIEDRDFLIRDPDNRLPEYLNTGVFSQHDFRVVYEVREGVTLRAGVTNAFDEEPAEHIQTSGGFDDIFDIFGRRFFVGLNLRR